MSREGWANIKFKKSSESFEMSSPSGATRKNEKRKGGQKRKSGKRKKTQKNIAGKKLKTKSKDMNH